MYRVMIVDDEPPFIRSVKRAIEKSSTRFTVVAEVFNGAEAFEKLPDARPDVIFTDIKMPVMDGITLVNKLDTMNVKVFPVIISGYQDFDYAKSALRAGVVDYLLKPLDPEMVSELLFKLEKKLDALYYSMRVDLFQQIIYGLAVDEEQVSRYLDFSYFSVVAIRSGSLSTKTSSLFPRNSNKIAQMLNAAEFASIYGTDNIWLINGNDENETVIITGFDHLPQFGMGIISKGIHSILEQHKASQFITTVFAPDFIKLGQISDTIQRVYKTLGQKLVIGKNQLIDCCSALYSKDMEPPIISSNLENKITVLLQNKSMDMLKDELSKLLQIWEQEAYPQIWLEKMLKQVLRIFEKYLPGISIGTSINLEQQIDEVLSLSTDFGGLLRGVWDIVEDLLGASGGHSDASDDLMGRIDWYIKTHLTEALSLQSICDLFGVSQPYLSRLFRKYKSMSFNEYVTDVRISEAKRLMYEQPAMLMKDIAEIVGYRDQHYFSRVFKIITGQSPSEFRK